ncbi:FAD/NAD(P)-binding protein [Nocardioides dongkuii]|uniref:FAD/NAD(P)-binding protein n=1 Tax=Nocardioides dongkuii TaxID=2760089 RepID=UPI001878F9F4|nr:FAD/NAD(P)-binding protein [Nocardioides dongkuii]
MPTASEPVPVRVLVVGGGAGGVIAAARLLRTATADRPVEVRVVEAAGRVGPGLAYRTRHPLHTLNNYACRLSAHEDDPGDLVRWCRAHGVDAHEFSFLPRGVYGDYLSEVLDRVRVPAGSSVTRHLGRVVDVEPVPDAAYGEAPFLVSVDEEVGGRASYAADRVVLALGNPPPRRLAHLETLGERYVADPWAEDLVERVGPSDRVLLVGTGLTALDVTAQLHAADPAVEIVAVSRHGLLPQPHRARPVPTGPWVPPSGGLATVLGSTRAAVEAAGGEWRGVLDTLREHANRVWRSLDADAQQRFVRHVARHWEVRRHRSAPDLAARIDGLVAAGALRLASPHEVEAASFDKVVNCTGPSPVHTPGWNPLVDRLLDRGLLRPHPLGLGLDVDDLGQPLGRDGRATPGLHVVGAARRGRDWEVQAIPDLRGQAVAVADTVLGAGATAAA